MLVVDKNRRIQIVNAQTLSMFGYTNKELIGEAIELLIPEQHARQYRWLATNHVESPSISTKSQRRLSAIKKDGCEFPVSVSLTPATIDGELFITSAVRDMTELKEA